MASGGSSPRTRFVVVLTPPFPGAPLARLLGAEPLQLCAAGARARRRHG